MAKPPRLPITRYRAVVQKDGSYGVEITKPGQQPMVMNRFWTEAEADAWITTEQIRTAGDRLSGSKESTARTEVSEE